MNLNTTMNITANCAKVQREATLLQQQFKGAGIFITCMLYRLCVVVFQHADSATKVLTWE